MVSEWIRSRLEKGGPVALSLYAGTAAFVCYFSMYAYRKPRAIASKFWSHLSSR